MPSVTGFTNSVKKMTLLYCRHDYLSIGDNDDDIFNMNLIICNNLLATVLTVK